MIKRRHDNLNHGSGNNSNSNSKLTQIWELGAALKNTKMIKRDRQRIVSQLTTSSLSSVTFRQSLAREMEAKSVDFLDLQQKYESLWQTLIRNAIALAEESAIPSSSSRAKIKKLDDDLALLPFQLLKYCDIMCKTCFLSHTCSIDSKEDYSVRVERSFLSSKEAELVIAYNLELLSLCSKDPNSSKSDRIQCNESTVYEFWNMLAYICNSAPFVAMMSKQNLSNILHECTRVVRRSTKNIKLLSQRGVGIMEALRCQYSLIQNVTRLGVDILPMYDPILYLCNSWNLVVIDSQQFLNNQDGIKSQAMYIYGTISSLVAHHIVDSVVYLEKYKDGFLRGSKVIWRCLRNSTKLDEKLRGIMIDFYSVLL